MAFNLTEQSGGDDLMSTINTTPLVDVMLVLLIIFLITIPVVTHTVPVELPKERSQPVQAQQEDVNLAVTAEGKVFWNEQPVPDEGQLLARLKTVAHLPGGQKPSIQVRGDSGVPYERVGRVVLICQQAGIVKVGFVTEPPPRG